MKERTAVALYALEINWFLCLFMDSEMPGKKALFLRLIFSSFLAVEHLLIFALIAPRVPNGRNILANTVLYTSSRYSTMTMFKEPLLLVAFLDLSVRTPPVDLKARARAESFLTLQRPVSMCHLTPGPDMLSARTSHNTPTRCLRQCLVDFASVIIGLRRYSVA